MVGSDQDSAARLMLTAATVAAAAAHIWPVSSMLENMRKYIFF
jgi:type IV secretory pathway VirB2 component (pilin)